LYQYLRLNKLIVVEVSYQDHLKASSSNYLRLAVWELP